MAAATLLALFDDIAAVLDDIAVLSKVAAQRTSGVLGDDLALNAEQVAGVRAERELPVVWAVAKGSLKNKAILVPAALLISAFSKWAEWPLLLPLLLMIGGLYLCFEGFEKVWHKLFHADEEVEEEQELIENVENPQVDLVAYEAEKIKGAIRTDFILSAEIIVIALGIVANAGLGVQLAVLSAVALAMTVGVYGLVAAIVKLDDMGLFLVRRHATGPLNLLGRGLLATAPKLMRLLTVVGTAAMFMVGGSILVHGWPWLHHLMEAWTQGRGWIGSLIGIGGDLLTGVLAGGLVLMAVSIWGRLRSKSAD